MDSSLRPRSPPHLVEEEISNKLLVLDSLFPVVERLPGFTIQQCSGLYYIQGTIDQESLYNYTKRIGELSLGVKSVSDSRLTMHVLVRIARLQDPTKPLFPSLHCLRIVNTSNYLDFLDIFLPSALTTIELSAISEDDPHYASVLSFLECAIDQAPLISTLILGPGKIENQLLQICSKYKHLQCLDFRDVGISVTAHLLQDLGSLQHLEKFIFRDNGTSTYEIPDIPTIRLASEFSPKRTVTDVDEMLERPQSPFPGSPSPESRISLSVRRLSSDLPPNANDTVVVSTPAVAGSLFPALRTLEVDASFSLIEALVTKVSSSDLRVLSIDFTKLLKSKIWDPKKTGRSRPDVVPLLRFMILWGTSLVSINFKTDLTTTFSLPSDIFKTLLLGRDMKHLKITGMDIEPRLLREISYSKLEVLHLPVHSTTGSIAFNELHYIASTCPHLKSLRCRLRTFRAIPDLVPLSHGLEVLLVSNVKNQLDPPLLFKMARYLDSAFPYLKTVKQHFEKGNNAEQWGLVSDLVKVCQAVRKDERARHCIGKKK